ncbi:glutathione S-transferase 1-like isoform X1 [Limulus polyphemus]|uniref:Glutathione S-transferase 1-like isoform X1 n=1 Tax=Limulus polyphemus TaxID=6850 RepID=A0ABM1BPR4_LIMPO|nr:glutathione S-transferase 1-like isoform X1 [Limulus polyphemus]XP_013786298.1 glutathione S-transferase 1-like isoform X1 [Limulus polyphemus]
MNISPIDFYYFPLSAPCRAVDMVAGHLDIPLKKKFVNTWQGEQLKSEFLKLNPTHTVPTINDSGFVLWESRAIITYLADLYGKDDVFYPSNRRKRAVVDRMLYFDMGSLYRAIIDFQIPIMFRGEEPDAGKERVLLEKLAFLEQFLTDYPYVAGENLTVADLSILASVTFLEAIDFTLSSFPKIEAWLQRLRKELPYYQERNQDAIEEGKRMLSERK